MADDSGEAESGAEDQTRREIAGLNRRNTELEKEIAERDKAIADLQAKIDAGTNQSADLRAERAELAAAKQLLDVQARLIERAVQHEIDPGLAIEFARAGDPDGVFDRVLAEIDGRADAQVNQRIGGGTPPESSGRVERLPDLNGMTPEEIMRLPDGIRERAFQSVVMKAAE